MEILLKKVVSQKKPKYTGKRLVMLNDNSSLREINSHAKNASIKIASFSDYASQPQKYHDAFNEADGILFEQSGIVVLNENLDRQISMLTRPSKTNRPFIYSELERFVYALPSVPKRILTSKSIKSKPTFKDDKQATWGIHATNILNSKYTGKGVNVAILDTGFFINHPDFIGRVVNSKSFIRSQSVEDKNGHGSHCTGISSGHLHKKTKKIYGVAKDANIYIGKVLSNAGNGTDRGILAGMEWALTNNCKVISMSLGAEVSVGENYSNIYNDLAKKAFSKGSIIVAAAGNESDRDNGIINPVGHPANCPSIMAVAALDNQLDIAWFSCGGINGSDGQVDIAGPGVDIYSSWKATENYMKESGTSMATPFVAGIAALYWEAFPNASASDIWEYLTKNAKRLKINPSDIGSGLVQAP